MAILERYAQIAQRAFNSLSRDHGTVTSSSHHLHLTFNSLSRDHLIVGGRELQLLDADFQLPLSGSPRVKRIGGRDMTPAFNSLSRDHVITFLYVAYQVTEFSFNSLSRDHAFNVRAWVSGSPNSTFNSLSRDHRARFRDFPALRGFLPRRPFAQMNFETTI